MQDSIKTSWALWFPKASFLLGSLVILISISVLIGWAMEIQILKSISPKWISMKTNTALCFLLAGISITLQTPIKWHINPAYKKIFSVSAACIFGFIAILNLVEYLFNISPGIDELIFKDGPNPFGTLYPGRMAPSTVVCFLLLSISILSGNNKIFKTPVFQLPVFIVGGFSLAGLSGYIFDAQEMFSLGGFNSMAFHTVLCFLLLAVASLFSHSQEGLMKIVSGNTRGGKLIRRFLPSGMVLLFFMGWLHLQGEMFSVYDSRFGIGILIIAFIIVFAIVLFSTAYSLTEFEGELIKKNTELQNSLQETSEYKYALDQSSIVSITDNEGKIKFVNKNFIKISKFSKEELIGQNHSIVNSGHHTKEFFNTLWTTIFAGKVWRNDVKSKAKDGTYYWADTTIIPFMNDKGKPYQYIAIRNDITQRKEVEKALIDSEAKFHTLYDTSSDAVMMLNNFSFFDCNSATLKMFGCNSKEEFYSKHPADLSPAAQPDGIDSMILANQRIATAIESGSNFFEWIHCRADTGETFPAEVLLNRMELDGEQVLQATVRDITERKLAEKRLFKSQQDFKNFIQDSMLAIYFFNADSEKIIYANPAFSQLLGYLPEEINSLTLYDFINHPKKETDSILNSVKQTDQYNIGDREWKCKDGQLINMYVNASSGTFDGANIIYISAQNISKLKQAEKETEKLLAELSDKYNELMQFNYIVSHNLRAPIANILGLASIINMPNIKKEEKPKIFNYIQSAAEKMDEMVKDLGIILSARTPLNDKKEKVNIHNLIHRISDTLENQIFESGCIINTELSDDAIEVFSIKSYMESIVYNLISNAIKYKSPKRRPQITISSKKINDSILIKVSDNGRGIDLSQHEESIFGLYKRFHLEIEGKGLGLHMTKTQVEALGGKIAVESEPGEGTTFTITLPA